MQPRKCAECGAEFTPKQPHQKFCSKQCAKRVEKRNNARYYRSHRAISPSEQMCRDAAFAHQCGTLTPNEWIMHAPRKPNGVSAVRWRIELRRRANAKYFAECGEATND